MCTTMKKIIYISSLLGVLSLTSCEKLLDEKPEYTVNSITAFESETSANMALQGCYAYLTEYNLYGQNFQELLVGPSGLAYGQNNNIGYAEFVSLNISETNTTVSLSWSGLYKVISECNYLIAGVEKSNLSDAFKSQAIGEARFLRALCYFNLANLFGGVPLRIDPTTSTTVDLPKSTREQVYAQAEQDWKYAAENLNAAKTSGRASKYAAYAYLTKLYWTLASAEGGSSANWVKAKEMGDQVIALGGYNLEDKFSKLFENKSLGSVESIFQINFSSNTNGYGNRGNWVFSPTNSSNPGISWARYRASKAFYDQFRGTYPDDPRLETTFMVQFKLIKTNNTVHYTYPYLYGAATTNTLSTDSVNYATLEDPTNPKVSELSEAMQVAFVRNGGRDYSWPYFKKQFDAAAMAQNSNKNLLVYRYADFLLIMADVENELGNNSEAISYINKVLTRARNSAPNRTYPKNITTSTQSELRDKIFDERLFELAGEFDNFTDIRRRGVEYFAKVLERHDNHHITRAQVEYNKSLNNNLAFMDYLILENVNKTELLKRNLLLPIPRNELNTNGGLTNEDQNYGY